MDNLDDRLWNKRVTPADYAHNSEKYQAAVLDQYKTYVEMADRVSSRRSLANTFFLSLNTAVVAAVATTTTGTTWQDVSLLAPLAGLIILLTQCLTWFVTVRSYRQLNAAKFAVIAALEKKLPAFVYSEAEWHVLGEGKNWRQYLPLTHVEQWVPLIFAAAYVLGFVALVT
ncbi:DUF1622 domain-containing protein [Streptomyces sp. NBC_01351]|uniref:RipA family octameric membrane protein n=1 Tax=Streptomyces sp. NBC_01351 TaxID=2903833 RepID=UPI002E2F3B1E|nr:hypothetical protein [Streptomyces sp. NBC_01351]